MPRAKCKSYSVKIEGEGKNRVIRYNHLARSFVPPSTSLQQYINHAIVMLYQMHFGTVDVTPLDALHALQEHFNVSLASIVEASIYINYMSTRGNYENHH